MMKFFDFASFLSVIFLAECQMSGSLSCACLTKPPFVNEPEHLNRSAHLIKTGQLLSRWFHGCGPFLSKEKMPESVDDTNNQVGSDE